MFIKREFFGQSGFAKRRTLTERTCKLQLRGAFGQTRYKPQVLWQISDAFQILVCTWLGVTLLAHQIRYYRMLAIVQVPLRR